MPILLQLYIEFFKTGLFAIGGGLATLPFLYEMSEKTGWFTVNDIANLVAVSESTPGPMGVNMGTYVGYTTSGMIGSVVAPLGLITPSVIIIIIISRFLKKFKNNKYVNYAFYGLRAASTALIVAAGLSVAKLAFIKDENVLSRLSALPGLPVSSLLGMINWISLLISVVVFITFRKLKKHPIFYIIGSAFAGVLSGILLA